MIRVERHPHRGWPQQGPERSTYFVSLAPTLTEYLDLKAFAAWLKEKGLQGGGSGTTLQGGAPKIDLDREYQIKKWLHDHARTKA